MKIIELELNYDSIIYDRINLLYNILIAHMLTYYDLSANLNLVSLVQLIMI